MIYWISTVESAEQERPYSICLLVRRRHVKKMSIDTLNEVMLLPCVEEMPGINTSIYYFGGTFTYCSFHVKDEQLTSTAFL